jgi:hypothetical protein
MLADLTDHESPSPGSTRPWGRRGSLRRSALAADLRIRGSIRYAYMGAIYAYLDSNFLPGGIALIPHGWDQGFSCFPGRRGPTAEPSIGDPWQRERRMSCGEYRGFLMRSDGAWWPYGGRGERLGFPRAASKIICRQEKFSRRRPTLWPLHVSSTQLAPRSGG